MIPFLQIFVWFCVLVIVGFVLLWIWAEIIIKRANKNKTQKDNFNAICAEYQKQKTKEDKGVAATKPDDQQPTKISDYSDPFVWHNENGKLYLIATTCVGQCFPGCRIVFRDFDFNCVGKTFNPNANIGYIVIESNRPTLVDTELVFPITYDKAFSVQKVLIGYQSLTSSAPTKILEISTETPFTKTLESQKTDKSMQIRAHDDKQIAPQPDTTIDKISVSSPKELIKDTPPLEFSDFFEWQKDGDYLVLVAKVHICEKLGNTAIKYEEMSINYTAEKKIFIPNELIGTIQIVGGEYLCDVIFEFPIVFDEECIVTEKYIFLQTHSSHAPFLVLRLSKNPAIIRAAKRQNKIISYGRTILMEQRLRKAELAERAEIEAKIKERHRKKQLEKQVEADLVERGEIFKEARRPPIPKDVQDVVYNRDGGKCVLCGSVKNLHFDHIIPFSKGGATNIENLQILCQKCNLEKSNNIG